MARTATKESDAVEQAEEVASKVTIDPIVESQLRVGAVDPRNYPYPIHTIVRGIGVMSNPDAGVFHAIEVGAYLNFWYECGFKLQSTHYGGQTKEPMGGAPVHNMIYVVAKE